MLGAVFWLVLLVHHSSASRSNQDQDIFGPRENSEGEGVGCNDVCAQHPNFCHDRGLCVGGASRWTAHCQCDSPYWGRRCQFNSECTHPADGDCYYGNITGKHTNDDGVIWLATNTKPGESVSLESEEIAAVQDYRIILSYDMTAWDSDRTPVFKSPDDFDSIEIKTRSCGDVGQRPYCWLGDSPSQCTTPPENRPCLWNSTIVYASHDFDRETCVDITHGCDNRNFFQFGLKAKCNNRNGCNKRDPHFTSTWQKGMTFFRYRFRVEPGRCQYDSGSYSDGPAGGISSS